MARPATRSKPINTALPKGRKSTQRERLLSGMVTAANREGYAGANVSAVIEHAGVSRPTFYDYFADRDECFIATITDTHERLASGVREALAKEPPALAIQASIGAIVAFASAEPARAHFLMSESMSGGPRALDARDQGILELERIVLRARRGAPAGTKTPDLPARIAIGGTYRMLASRLRRGEPDLAAIAAELTRWISSYASPTSEHRWEGMKPRAAPAPSPFVAQTPPSAPKPLGPGRPGLSREQVASNHRERVLYAAAQLAEEKGYVATTVADITRRAGIDGRAYYNVFLDKQDTFMTLHELGLQQVLDVTASAFFSGASWPERTWEAARAFTQFLQVNPLIAHIGFVEANAVGPGAAQRLQDSHAAFAIFLQEGYLHVSEDPPPTRAAVEAIVTTLFEMVYEQARASTQPKLAGLTGLTAFVCLAPFLGAVEANRFLDTTSADRPRTTAPRSRQRAGSRSRPKR